MTSIQRRGCLAKGQASKAPTRPTSNRSNDGDYEDPLEFNKPRPFKVPAEAFAGPPQAPLPEAKIDVARLTQKNLDQII